MASSKPIHERLLEKARLFHAENINNPPLDPKSEASNRAQIRSEITSALNFYLDCKYASEGKIRYPVYELGDDPPLFDAPGYVGASKNFPGARLPSEPVLNSVEEARHILAERQTKRGWSRVYEPLAAMAYIMITPPTFSSSNGKVIAGACDYHREAFLSPVLQLTQKTPNKPPVAPKGTMVHWWYTRGTPESQWRMESYFAWDGNRYDRKIMQYRHEIWPPHLHVKTNLDVEWSEQTMGNGCPSVGAFIKVVDGPVSRGH